MADKAVGLTDHKVSLSKAPFADATLNSDEHACPVQLNENGGVSISNEEMAAAFKMLDTDSSGSCKVHLLFMHRISTCVYSSYSSLHFLNLLFLSARLSLNTNTTKLFPHPSFRPGGFVGLFAIYSPLLLFPLSCVFSPLLQFVIIFLFLLYVSLFCAI